MAAAAWQPFSSRITLVLGFQPASAANGLAAPRCGGAGLVLLEGGAGRARVGRQGCGQRSTTIRPTSRRLCSIGSYSSASRTASSSLEPARWPPARSPAGRNSTSSRSSMVGRDGIERDDAGLHDVGLQSSGQPIAAAVEGASGSGRPDDRRRGCRGPRPGRPLLRRRLAGECRGHLAGISAVAWVQVWAMPVVGVGHG